MAFKLYKAMGARVPDIVSHLVSAAGLTAAEVESGTLVTIASGLLDVAATSNKVAGIITSEYQGDAAVFSSRGGSVTRTFPDGAAAGTEIPFLPVTGTVPVIADVEGTVAIGALLPGEFGDIAGAGKTIADAQVNNDFYVTKVIDDGTNLTHVIGFFANPGYFVS